MSSGNSETLYRAPFVVPVAGSVIEDGAVLVKDGKITAVGGFSDLQQKCKQVIDLPGKIITPALINCHAHLELSYMAGKACEPEIAGDISTWISSLLATREQGGVTEDEVSQAARVACDSLYESGVALTVDIGNILESSKLSEQSDLEVKFYLELMGVARQAAHDTRLRLATLSEVPCTAHGLYSTRPFLVQDIKKQSRRQRNLFPIHTAESLDEIEFLQSGNGAFRDFLETRLQAAGWGDDNLAELIPTPGCGAVEYLDRLGVLDKNTICVHSVHISESEAELLVKKKAKVCLCPGSNRFLGVGVAPLPMLLACGIRPGLGTDSLASNRQLSIWQEMKILQEDHPEVDPAQVFACATQGGAATLGVEDDLGELAVGKSAKMIAVTGEGLQLDEVNSYLVNIGKVEVEWLGEVNDR